MEGAIHRGEGTHNCTPPAAAKSYGLRVSRLLLDPRTGVRASAALALAQMDAVRAYFNALSKDSEIRKQLGL